MPQLTSLEEFVELVEQQKFPSDLVLDFSNSPIQATDLETIVAVLSSGQCPAGLELEFSGNKSNPGIASAIATALKSGNCPKNLKISLSNAGVDAKGLSAIAAALSSGQCPAGLEIYLSNNSLGPIGAKYIARALKSGNCPNGLQIGFWGNNIGCAGAAVIAEALESGNCPKNLYLDISYNDIGSEGAKHIARALASRNCPENLILGFTLNLLRDEDKEIILQSVAQRNQSAYPNNLWLNIHDNNALSNGIVPINLCSFLYNESRLKPGILRARVTGLHNSIQTQLNKIYYRNDILASRFVIKFVVAKIVFSRQIPPELCGLMLEWLGIKLENSELSSSETKLACLEDNSWTGEAISNFIATQSARLQGMRSQSLRGIKKRNKFDALKIQFEDKKTPEEYKSLLQELAETCHYQRNPCKDTAAVVLSFGLFGLYNRYKYGTFSHQAQSWHEFKRLKIPGLEAEHQEIIRQIERDGVKPAAPRMGR